MRGCYKFASYPAVPDGGASPREVTLLGSGAILTEVIKAARMLATEGKTVHVHCVTSWSELARDGAAIEASAIAGNSSPHKAVPHITMQLQSGEGPVVAATDYVRAVPESVRAFVPPGRIYLTLGTDGFGRSDTMAALRAYFGVGAAGVVRAAHHALCPVDRFAGEASCRGEPDEQA